MFHDLGIVRAWKIPRTTLKMFLLAVRERYQDNPYHNFQHCFCVTQVNFSNFIILYFPPTMGIRVVVDKVKTKSMQKICF